VRAFVETIEVANVVSFEGARPNVGSRLRPGRALVCVDKGRKLVHVLVSGYQRPLSNLVRPMLDLACAA
jgi:hypothetical protein